MLEPFPFPLAGPGPGGGTMPGAIPDAFGVEVGKPPGRAGGGANLPGGGGKPDIALPENR